MQITGRFTIAVHIITCIDYFSPDHQVTSGFLSASTGVNPVIVRGVLSQLKEAGIVNTRQGAGGVTLNRPLDQISFYDIYKAVDSVKDEGLFRFHEHPSPDCPVGRNIHSAVDGRLDQVQTAMENEMKEIKLSDVVQDVREQITKEY